MADKPNLVVVPIDPAVEKFATSFLDEQPESSTGEGEGSGGEDPGGENPSGPHGEEGETT